MKVLTTLASVAAIRVENARLIEARLERERLERELALASEIQQRFQPTAPHVNGYELQGISFPCYEIGGDYYDFIEREDGRLVIALGDVSGKGTAAALLMSSLHAAIHAQSASHDSLVATISAVKVSRGQHSREPFRHVVLCGARSGIGRALVFECGTQSALIIHSAGTVEQLASGGLPLGIKRDAESRGRTQLAAEMCS